jgi:hypothetical protein
MQPLGRQMRSDPIAQRPRFSPGAFLSHAVVYTPVSFFDPLDLSRPHAPALERTMLQCLSTARAFFHETSLCCPGQRLPVFAHGRFLAALLD